MPGGQSRGATAGCGVGYPRVVLAGGLCGGPNRDALVVVVGGLGMSQLGDLSNAVEKRCPEATVVSAWGVGRVQSRHQVPRLRRPIRISG